LNTATTDFVFVCAHRQTALKAMRTLPGQVRFTCSADTDGAARLTTEHAPRWQNQVEWSGPPMAVNLKCVYRLTGHLVLFILHAPVGPVRVTDSIFETGVWKP